MKVSFVGNCQAEAISRILKRSNPGLDVVYETVTPRYGDFNADRCHENMQSSQIIVAQAIENRSNEFYRENLRNTYGDRLVFYPYIYCDGIFSMSFFPGGPNTQPYGVINFEPILESLLQYGFQETVMRFRKGDIEFNHAKRLSANIKTARANEKLTSIDWVSDFEELLTNRRLMITHNHPNPELLKLISRKIADVTGLRFSEVRPSDHLLYSLVTLPNPGAIITPFAVSELGLKYDYDLQWFPTGRRLIAHINKALEQSTKEG